MIPSEFDYLDWRQQFTLLMMLLRERGLDQGVNAVINFLVLDDRSRPFPPANSRALRGLIIRLRPVASPEIVRELKAAYRDRRNWDRYHRREE